MRGSGLWRVRSSYLKRLAEHDRKCRLMDAAETWRLGVYPPSLDLDAIPPPMVPVGKRAAKRLRRALQEAKP